MMASNGILSNPANFTPPMGLAYFTLHAAKQWVAIAYVMKNAEFLSECGRAICFFSQSSKLNELIFKQNVLR